LAAENKPFEQWGAVDVMGHQRYYGLITEKVIGGTGFIRVDVPGNADRPPFTKLLGSSAIYSISPLDEALTRELAAEARETPIESYRLPKFATAKVGITHENEAAE
jgi:hypothetical protein